MANVKFYSGGGSRPLGGQIDEIPYITAKPGQLNTVASTRYGFAAKMVEALMAKSEANKEKKIRTDMLAAMLGGKHEYDPSKALESFTPSPYMQNQRDASADAQPEGASALGLGSDSMSNFDYSTGFEPEDVQGMAQAPSSGISSESLALPKFESTDFTPQPNLGDSGAMQAALIGNVKTPEQELAAYAGSPEEMAAQERNYKATVNTPDAVAARMAEAVRLNPEIANHPAYQEWAISQLENQQRLDAESIARGREVDALGEQRLYDEGRSDIENQREIDAAIAKAKADIELQQIKNQPNSNSSIKPTKPDTFDMPDSVEIRQQFGLPKNSVGTYTYKQDLNTGAYTLQRIGDANPDADKGSRSTVLSLYEEQTRLEETLVDMDREGVLATDPERLRIANRLDVLKTIINLDALKQAEGAYGEAGGKAKQGRDSLDYEQAQAAVTDLERDEKLIRLLHKGNATTGFAAEWIQNINRTVNFFKDDERLAEGISDTQLVNVLMGAQVFPLIQALGIGARGMDTPAEREFMRKVLTGTLTLDKETLLEMARMRQKQSAGSIKNWDTRLNRGEVDDYLAVNRISKENARIQNPYSDENRIAAINEMNLDQVIQYKHPGLPEKVKEAILSRIRALK